MFEEVEFGGGLRGVADANTTKENKVVVVVFPGEIVLGVTAVEFFRDSVDGKGEIFGRLNDGGRIYFSGPLWTEVPD